MNSSLQQAAFTISERMLELPPVFPHFSFLSAAVMSRSFGFSPSAGLTGAFSSSSASNWERTFSTREKCRNHCWYLEALELQRFPCKWKCTQLVSQSPYTPPNFLPTKSPLLGLVCHGLEPAVFCFSTARRASPRAWRNLLGLPLANHFEYKLFRCWRRISSAPALSLNQSGSLYPGRSLLPHLLVFAISPPQNYLVATCFEHSLLSLLGRLRESVSSFHSHLRLRGVSSTHKCKHIKPLPQRLRSTICFVITNSYAYTQQLVVSMALSTPQHRGIQASPAVSSMHDAVPLLALRVLPCLFFFSNHMLHITASLVEINISSSLPALVHSPYPWGPRMGLPLPAVIPRGR